MFIYKINGNEIEQSNNLSNNDFSFLNNVCISFMSFLPSFNDVKYLKGRHYLLRNGVFIW